MSKSLYLKLNQISEVHEKDVYLKDVAELYSDDPAILAKCLALKVKKISSDRDHRYVGSVLDVIGLISKLDPSIQVENMGEQDFIIDYQKPRPPRLGWEWIKTAFVCVICFCGAAFAIMTFNNDASVTDVFREIYRMVLGHEAEKVTVLEMSYSIGLALGVILFFNHFCAWKVNTDPTPLEVEMRLYEDNISKTVIQNDGRKESGIDVD
ncbi:MAG: stage V sporulation protein AA [Hungatella sp.]|mgnify:FL=1|jgi:stage V sporulation protein AA|nr:stage V sporulation protein AA [Hungatella sp.]